MNSVAVNLSNRAPSAEARAATTTGYLHSCLYLQQEPRGVTRALNPDCHGMDTPVTEQDYSYYLRLPLFLPWPWMRQHQLKPPGSTAEAHMHSKFLLLVVCVLSMLRPNNTLQMVSQHRGAHPTTLAKTPEPKSLDMLSVEDKAREHRMPQFWSQFLPVTSKKIHSANKMSMVKTLSQMKPRGLPAAFWRLQGTQRPSLKLERIQYNVASDTGGTFEADLLW